VHDVSFPLVLRHRLKALGTEQRDLAAAAQVTESYISQLVTGKKRPPAPERTDIYERMETFLKLPAGELVRLAELERREALKRILAEPPTPLLTGVRELMLRKCVTAKRPSVRAIFEREPFGALEHLVIQKLLDVVKKVAREELADEQWLRRMARIGRRSYTQMRVIVLEFLETEALSISADHCVTFLDPLIESWDIDLTTFAMEIVLNRRLATARSTRFEFVERDDPPPHDDEPGLREFLADPTLSADITPKELAFLKKLAFAGRRPTALYYYRELQSLRDPLHFL
jgi:transcriptional regulator with XRE-family HTH domain